MTDITNTHLEAAIIDQCVAGAFGEELYAFVAIYAEGFWQLGVAVANERGYNPVAGKTFDDQAEAKLWADSLNRHICLDDDLVCGIICSTMGGRSVTQYTKLAYGAAR